MLRLGLSKHLGLVFTMCSNPSMQLRLPIPVGHIRPMMLHSKSKLPQDLFPKTKVKLIIGLIIGHDAYGS